MSMSPYVWFVMLVVVVMALVALDQIQLVQDLVTASGYSSSEVFAGLGGIFLVFWVMVGIIEVR